MAIMITKKDLKATDMVGHVQNKIIHKMYIGFPWKELITIQTHQAVQEQVFTLQGKSAPVMATPNRLAFIESCICYDTWHIAPNTMVSYRYDNFWDSYHWHRQLKIGERQMYNTCWNTATVISQFWSCDKFKRFPTYSNKYTYWWHLRLALNAFTNLVLMSNINRGTL